MQSASLMTARRIYNFWWWRRPLMCTCKIYTQQPTEMVCVQCKMRVYTWWMWCAYRCKEDNLESMRWRQQSQSWNEKLIDEMIETPPKTIRRRSKYTLTFSFVVCAPHNVRYTFSLVSIHTWRGEWTTKNQEGAKNRSVSRPGRSSVNMFDWYLCMLSFCLVSGLILMIFSELNETSAYQITAITST